MASFPCSVFMAQRSCGDAGLELPLLVHWPELPPKPPRSQHQKVFPPFMSVAWTEVRETHCWGHTASGSETACDHQATCTQASNFMPFSCRDGVPHCHKGTKLHLALKLGSHKLSSIPGSDLELRAPPPAHPHCQVTSCRTFCSHLVVNSARMIPNL